VGYLPSPLAPMGAVGKGLKALTAVRELGKALTVRRKTLFGENKPSLKSGWGRRRSSVEARETVWSEGRQASTNEPPKCQCLNSGVASTGGYQLRFARPQRRGFILFFPEPPPLRLTYIKTWR